MNRTRNAIAVVGLMLASAAAFAQTASVDITPQTFVADAIGARDVEVSRFGTYVAVYDTTEGNSIRVFDANLNQLWRTRLPYYWAGSLAQGSVIQFAPDESFIAFPGVRDKTNICIADAATGEQIQILRGHSDNVDAIALSPDAHWLVSAGHHEMILWEREPDGYVQRAALTDIAGSFHSLEFLADGRRVVLTTTDHFTRAVEIYSIVDGTLERTFVSSFEDRNISNEIDQVAVSPDGRWLAAGYRDSVLVFSLTGAKPRLVQTIADIDLETVFSLTFAPDSGHLVTGHFAFIRWWNLEGGTWVEGATSATQQPVPNDIEISTDGRSLYLASRADENAVVRFSVSGIDGAPISSVVDAIGGPLSPAQRAVLTDARAESIVATVGDTALAPRDMFETTDEYETRIGSAYAKIRAGVYDAIEERYGLERITNDAARYDLSIPLQGQGTYDIDRQRYSVRVLDESAWIQIDRAAARGLYQQWQDARVRATRYLRSGTDDYADFRLIHPDTGAAYPVVFDHNPFTGERMNVVRNVVPAVAIGTSVVVRDLQIDAIFPTLYARYAVEPVGRFTIANTGSGIVSDLDVRFSIEGLASEHRVELPRSIAAGQEVEGELVAPMSADVLSGGEGSTAALTLSVSYRRGNVTYRDAITRQVRVLNRNAIQWTDDRRVGSFMSVAQPAVLSWSGAYATSELPTTSILTRNLLYAMQLFESLTAAGINYVVDPNSAYETLSQDQRAVDFLRFPAETLTQAVGDCDDLSVLYATLLESVGVDTAFITTPGHIFVAFDTGIAADQASRYFESPSWLIERDRTAWMPIETTLIASGFTRAWQTAALEWQQSADTRALFVTHDAWTSYPPVAAPGAAAAPRPDSASVAEGTRKELDSFRELELAPKLDRIRGDSANADSPERQNRLGVLYATYGLLNEATDHFQTALVNDEYVPALINQANVLSLQSRPDEARTYLERARAVDPQNARVLLGLAFSQLESGNEAEARSTYEVASRVSPSLARRFPLFGSGTDDASRAGITVDLFSTDWAEEP